MHQIGRDDPILEYFLDESQFIKVVLEPERKNVVVNYGCLPKIFCFMLL